MESAESREKNADSAMDSTIPQNLGKKTQILRWIL